MVWLLLFLGVLGFAWFLFVPRRVETRVDGLRGGADDRVQDNAARPDLPAPGSVDPLTFDWIDQAGETRRGEQHPD